MKEGSFKDELENHKCPITAVMDQSRKSECVVTAVPLINEAQLTATTGGNELYCYRCVAPFGVIILIAGVVVTAIAYNIDSSRSVLLIFGLILLTFGILLMIFSAICWKIRQRRKSAKEEKT
ncbi:transmembrane protein 100-like [Protopterus annectens]|uniref:transmembrane protein 100-like n=1 Tax=Protopterus annectens TaxID=7888 RepID=UPI001CF9B61F|nr:transmembrane protein 100-like [Protopterus annectens]